MRGRTRLQRHPLSVPMPAAMPAQRAYLRHLGHSRREMEPRATMRRLLSQDLRRLFFRRFGSDGGRGRRRDRARGGALLRLHGRLPSDPWWVLVSRWGCGRALGACRLTSSSSIDYASSQAGFHHRGLGDRRGSERGCGGAVFSTTLGGNWCCQRTRGPRARRAQPQPSVQGSCLYALRAQQGAQLIEASLEA